MTLKFTILSTVLLLLTTPVIVSAQFSPLGSNGTTLNAAELRVLPSYYEPNDVVTVELNAYTLNTNGASITWRIDGVEQSNAKDQRSLTMSTGELGTTQAVQAVITLTNGSQVTARTTVRPIRIDMLVEADTFTPAFYTGRALPSNGSTVVVKAIPFTDSNQPQSNLSYSWQVGREVVGGGAQIGKDRITFTPGFEKATRVQVTVFDTNGRSLGSRTITIPIAEPEIHFYEINPLRGLQTQALGSTAPFRGIEMQVKAEPYYMSRGKQSDELHMAWKLDNQTISNPSADPRQITLRRQGTRGNFQLEFEIRNLTELLQGAKKAMTLQF